MVKQDFDLKLQGAGRKFGLGVVLNRYCIDENYINDATDLVNKLSKKRSKKVTSEEVAQKLVGSSSFMERGIGTAIDMHLLVGDEVVAKVGVWYLDSREDISNYIVLMAKNRSGYDTKALDKAVRALAGIVDSNSDIRETLIENERVAMLTYVNIMEHCELNKLDLLKEVIVYAKQVSGLIDCKEIYSFILDVDLLTGDRALDKRHLSAVGKLLLMKSAKEVEGRNDGEYLYTTFFTDEAINMVNMHK